MTPAEIAETLINGNIHDARTAILTRGGGLLPRKEVAIRALDVAVALSDMEGSTDREALERLRRCLTGEP